MWLNAITTLSSVSVTSNITNAALTASKPVFTDASKNLTSSGTLAVDQGGTGAATLTANNVILGNGTSAPTFVAPSTTGNVLTSNGTTWTSATITSFVAGMIIMWSGTIATIPSGWLLCNGSNSTPDLRDKFIIGANADSGGAAKTNITGTPSQTGGTKDAIVVSHTHTATSTVTDPSHTHNLQNAFSGSPNGGSPFIAGAASNGGGTPATSSASTGITVATSISTEGSSGTNQNLPPYYALAFIMKS